ncbi:MAG: hypothetical protein DRQ78_08565 [Epsilonproteobacteria bacterium]|nr:MAG: hypothetical protein DRQ78_08565 [Campylobacterota bacterium]
MSSLPKLTVPTHFLTIPSTKKKVKFRPFLSREEKILMLVKQSTDQDEILTAMKDIINVCTYEKLDIDRLAMFDIEYIFLRLRAKSVGEVIEIDMKCTNEVEIETEVEEPTKTKPCGNLIPFAINIENINVSTPKDHTKIIKLQKDIGITLRYPSVSDLKIIDDLGTDDVSIIKYLMENIFDEENVYNIKDTSEGDVNEFMDTISSKQIEDIRKKFFYTMPSLEYKAKYKCSKCGYKGEYTFKGINDFF